MFDFNFEAWKKRPFEQVVTKFVYNVKDSSYKLIVAHMIDKIKNLRCLMTIKV